MAVAEVRGGVPARLRTELDAERIIGSWIDFYNEVRPHSSLGGRTPGETYRDCARAAMNGPRRVRPAGVERPQTPARSRVGALSRAQGRIPMRPRAGGAQPLRRLREPSPPASKPRSPVGFPSRRPGLTLHTTKVPEGSQTQPESTFSFALGLSNEVGPPHETSADPHVPSSWTGVGWPPGGVLGAAVWLRSCRPMATGCSRRT